MPLDSYDIYAFQQLAEAGKGVGLERRRVALASYPATGVTRLSMIMYQITVNTRCDTYCR